MKCDRALLEAAERVASNGPIGLVDAMDLWDKAKDGVGLRSFLLDLLIVPPILDRFGEYIPYMISQDNLVLGRCKKIWW